MRLPSKISTMRLLFLSCLLSVVCDAFVQTSGSGTSLLTLSARISLLREADRSFTPSKGNTKFTTKMVLVNGESDFENLPYRELQHIAKANHIRANQPISALRRTLEKKAAKESGNPASPSNAEEKAGPSAENEAMTTMGHFNTVAVHGAGKTKDALGAVTMPIYQTSTFRFESAEHGAACFAGESNGYIYSRINNPTIRELEQTVAALEHGIDAIACSSGMGAVNVVYMGILASGSHVVCHKTVYGPSRSLLENVMVKNFGVEVDFVDTCDLKAVKAAIRPETKLIFLESPANPTIAITDVAAVSQLAKDVGALVCVDNTFSSPYLFNPLDQGAHLVLHSLTKSINGHADVLGGMIVCKDAALYKKLRPMMIVLGPCMDPNQAFLIRRGLKTLGIRMEAAQANAGKVAEFLEAHPKIAWVRYPGLKSHPQHQLGLKTLKGPGAMISFGVEGGLNAGRKLLNSVKVCILAVSLGGIETLIQHPASMTHAKLSKEARLQGDVTDDLVRLSVGIEDVDEIIDDLKQALQAI